MLGIIGAMEIEVKRLVSEMDDGQMRVVSSIPFWQGTLRGTPVVVGRCGVGKVNAAICAQLMITTFGADAVVNTGVAGGLAQAMHQCDLIIASGFVQHDMDTSPIGDPPGFISGPDIVELPVDKALAERLRQCALLIEGVNLHSGVIATGDQFIADADRSRQITELFGASACDMEGGAIAQVCMMAGVPLGAVRCISDNADGSAGMTYVNFAPIAAERCARLVISFAEGLR